jgi:lipoprotein-anchoring transpeptidase ErfK/SrfK
MPNLVEFKKVAYWHNVWLTTTVILAISTFVFGVLYFSDGNDLDGKQKLIISVKDQKAYFYANHSLINIYEISTATKGTGQLSGSDQTPLGEHIVYEKDAANTPYAGRLVGRKYDGHITTIYYDKSSPSQIYITTRVIRIMGLEQGYNKGKNKNGQVVDTYERFIYLQGSNIDGRLGTPSSGGSIHFSNLDIMRLFDMIDLKTHVIIQSESHHPV